jgi:hypothetical protein
MSSLEVRYPGLREAWAAVEKAERQLLRSCGWRHLPPHGWTHQQWSLRPLPQSEAVTETRRRVVRQALLLQG